MKVGGGYLRWHIAHPSTTICPEATSAARRDFQRSHKTWCYVNWKVLLVWVLFYLTFLCFIYKSYDSVEWVPQSEFFSDLGKNNLGGKSLFWNYCLLFHMFQWTQEIYDVLLITFCSYLPFCPLKDERILSLFPLSFRLAI